MDYETRLLPHPYLAELEPRELDSEGVGPTRLSPGYPAWSLLYYAILCSIDPDLEDIVVIETGTNRGVSTIVMAAALKDLGANARVRTVELNPALSDAARSNVASAGLSDLVEFNVGDSHDFLRQVCAEVDHIDFAFLDADHSAKHALGEFELIHPKVVARNGKVHFDNTSAGGVAKAVSLIKERYGGNLVQFDNCSWEPPGNAIWQPG